MNLSTEKKKVEKLTAEGLKKLASNDYEAAARVFERVRYLDEDNPIANTLGAVSLLNLGRLDEAEPLARKGARLSPQLGLAHCCLALILIANEKNEEGESEIWEAVALEPHNAEYRLVLGRLLFLQSREAEAREQVHRCLDLSAENPEAHFLLGVSLMRSGKISEAKDELEATLRLDSENDGALAIDGLLWMAKSDDLMTTPPKLAGYRHAAALLRRALELNPDNEVASEWLRLAEKTIERISKPSDPQPLPERWYKEFSKLLFVWVGLAALAIGMFAFIVWVDESKVVDFWAMALAILIFELLAFGLMLYIRRDFSALPPTIVTFVEGVTEKKISPIEPHVKD